MFIYISNLLKSWKVNAVVADHLAVLSVILGIIFISYLLHLLYKIFSSFCPSLKKTEHITSQWIKIAERYYIHKKLYFLGHLLFIALLFKVIITLERLSTAMWIVEIARTILGLSIVGLTAFLISSLLDVVNEVYKTSFKFARQRPIKSYLDFLKIMIWIVAIIVAISIFTNKSPATMLAGLGAISAVGMLVFKDSILGFITSIQLAAYDLVRIGDWIQINKYNVDGDVIDISLNTVKVQNFDKTIVTIPTYELVATGVTNWRGMQESGGRRIKRSVNINVDTIKLCDQKLLKKLSKLKHLKPFIERKIKKMSSVPNKNIIDHDKELTNVSLYREYVRSYLNKRGDIQTKNFTFLIRELQPTETGLPVEIYVFTKTINWAEYEEIQADVFDHIISVLPYFELKLFQNISSMNTSSDLYNKHY